MTLDEFEADEEIETAPPVETEDDRAQQLRLVEALLFASAAPLDEAAITERLPKGIDVAGLIAQLTEDYGGRGVNLVFVAGGWTFRTATDLADKLRLEKIVPRKLSRAGIETLAIIAYHQPVTRAEIEDIRGVAISKGTLDVLMETGWIAPMGRRETPGRPVTWGVTDTFLSHFGLADRNDLPGIEELKSAGLIGPRVTVLSEGTGTLPFMPPEELPQADEPEEEPDEPLAETDRAPDNDGE
ncbi:MAG TPA: SMC-Scp complex subunit ScpB [Stellaceae bacterium]|jgi:segregation and condensation protein B|nr:SMC-Scp complex subunit ScpB [Stellaceae bacterium]